jgi:hypothetical protein
VYRQVARKPFQAWTPDPRGISLPSIYLSAVDDRLCRDVPSCQYSAAVISPASGNIAVNGSAAQRIKNPKKLSVGGPESVPLLFQSIHVNGTNTAAPSTSPESHCESLSNRSKPASTSGAAEVAWVAPTHRDAQKANQGQNKQSWQKSRVKQKL